MGVSTSAQSFSERRYLLCHDRWLDSRNNALCQARAMLSLMKRTGGTSPRTLRIYNLFLDHYAQQGDFGSADAILQELKRTGLTANVQVYNTLMQECQSTLDSQLCLGCKVMSNYAIQAVLHSISPVFRQELHQKPDLQMCNTMLASCADHANVALATDILADMQQARLTPDAYSYASLVDSLDCYQVAGEMHRAMRVVLEIMPAVNLVPNVQTSWMALLQGWIKANDFTQAKAVFPQMRNTVTLDSRAYVVMVRGYCRFERQGAQGFWQGDAFCRSQAGCVSMFAFHNDIEQVRLTSKDMCSAGVKPQLATFAKMLSCYIGNDRVAELVS
eukprot:TRINITY_DN13413_c0_g1_i1.p1 TRINITY_DN13413_c0_g1~~TRINITY_DN13413_c0_g1_i1.p1  ORF type:complete len:331 (-),score=31.25 TRINITY_DN13413_c0_g1_i1:509-1501(-)